MEKIGYEDGCKVYFQGETPGAGAWIIIRFSGTEPRVRIFAENETMASARALVRTAAEFLGLEFNG